MMAQATGSTFEKPRFRQEQLVAEPIEDQGARFIDVMDPDSGNIFRFYEVEFSLACAMDGERDVAGIVKWAQEELGVSPSQAEVRTVISTLGELGYLDQTGDARAAAAAAPPRTREPELAPGIVVGMNARAAKSPTADVDLGHAGTKAPAFGEMPKAPDLALGAPGATAAKPRAPAEDVALGAPGRSSDVSLDLSDQMSVRPADVKEAVRASKVMASVDVPKELLDALEEPVEKPMAKAPIAKTPVSAAKPAVAAKPIAEKQPVELPKKPVVGRPSIEKSKPIVADKAAVPTAPPSKVSPLLIVVLLIALVGAAVYFAWKYVINASNDDSVQTSTTKEPVKPPPVKPPEPVKPPPPPPVIKLSMDTPTPIEVKAAAAAQIEAFETAKTIKRDAIVVKLVGNKAITNEITAITKDAKRVTDNIAQGEKNLAAATAANNAAKAKEAEDYLAERKARLDTLQGTLATKQADLAKLLIKAPADGELKVAVKAGAKVAENDVLFSIMAGPILVATFKADGAPPADSNVFVSVKGSDKPLTCRVTQVDKDGAKVVCPSDPLLDGVEAKLEGIAPADTPKPVETPTPTPQPQPKRPLQPKQPKPPEPKPDEPKPPEPKPDGSGTP